MKWNFRSFFYNHIWKIVIFVMLVSLNVLTFYKTFRTYREEPQYFYLYRMLGDSLCIARASAVAICLNTVAVMLTMCKVFVSGIRNILSSKFFSGLRRILDEKKSMHIMCGLSLCLLSVIHTAAHCVNNYYFCNNFDEENKDVNVFSSKEKINVFSIFFTVTGVTGLLMLVILLLLFTSSLASVRRKNYVIFWYTHHLAFPFIGLLIIHSYGCIIKRQNNLHDHWPGCVFTNNSQNANRTAYPNEKNICRSPPQFEHDPAQGWKWILVPLLCYIFDRLLRSWRGRKDVEIKEVIWHKGEVIELRLVQEGFKARPGQYIQIQCAEIANFEWHPFTITKCPSKDLVRDYFSVHIKVLGQWTESLSRRIVPLCRSESLPKQTELLFSHSKQIYESDLVSKAKWPRICVDGPYGGPCQDVTKFSVSVCIAAGIGVTPFAAVINSLRNQLDQGKIIRLYFIWISRELDAFHWFLELLHDFHKELAERNKPDLFVCKFFLTGDEESAKQDLSLSHKLSTEWLVSRLHFGRPCWNECFKQISRNHRRTKIGVFYTGSRSISPVIKRTCDKVTCHKNSFVFHKDSFG